MSDAENGEDYPQHLQQNIIPPGGLPQLVNANGPPVASTSPNASHGGAGSSGFKVEVSPVGGSGLFAGDPDADSVSFNRPQHINEAFQTMYALLQTDKLTDVVLRVGGEDVPAHRVVLAGASPYFRAMFTSGMLEADKRMIPLHGVSSRVVRLLLRFAYTGQIGISERNVCEVLPAAVMLQMSHVSAACCEFLRGQLHPSNCLGIGEFAHAHGCMELAVAADKFADRHFVELIRYEEYLQLSANRLSTLLRRDELNVRSEQDVFNAVITWASYKSPPTSTENIDDNNSNEEDSSSTGRAASLLQLLQYVRLHVLPPDFLNRQLSECSLLRSSEPAVRELLQRVCEDLRGHLHCPVRKRNHFPSVVYSAGGYFRYSLRNFEYLDLRGGAGTSIGNWERLPDLPSPRSGLAAVTVRGCLYLVGGRNNNELGNIDAANLDCFEPRGVPGQRWKACAPMSVPRNRLGVGVVDDMIYAVGGSASTNQHHNSCERFEPLRDVWVQCASMSTRRIGLGVAVVNRMVYAVGGYDGVQRLSSVERYDPDVDRWEPVSSMTQNRSGAGVVALDNYIYAIGGYDSFNQLQTVERYDTERNVWEFVAPMTKPRSALAACLLDGRIWAFGGYDGFEFLASVEVYDPTANKWTEVTHMNCGKSGHGIVVGAPPSYAN